MTNPPLFTFDGKCIKGFNSPVVLERKDEFGKPCASGELLAGLLDSAFRLGEAHGKYPLAAAELTALEQKMLTADAATDAKALDPMLADMGLETPRNPVEFIGSHDDLQPVRKGGVD